MTEILLFAGVAGLLGLAGLPLAAALFARLPSRGLVFARPLALLAVAAPAWLLASLHIAPYGRATIVGSLVVVLALAATLRRPALATLRDPAARRLWLVGEAVFAFSFAGWLVLRSFAPDVWQTEKPMDMALVNVVNRAEWFPPHDPWQAGTEVNYYYYGHYLVAFLVRLTGVDPAVGFNLSVALFYALVTAAVFGVAATLYDAARRHGDAPARSPVVVGLTAAAFATLVGNLAGGVQFLQDVGRIGTYDWWSPSRVIDGTANEFPFFSFLLADLHAHVMATPFTLVVVAYGIQLAVHGPPGIARARAWLAAPELTLAALVLGALYATNSFDFPTAFAVGAGGLLLWAFAGGHRWRRALAWGGCWLGGAVLLFLPFWLAFSPPTGGIGLVRDNLSFVEFARDYALIYGLALWGLVALFAGRFRFPLRYVAWGGSVALFVLVLLAPSNRAGPAIVLTLTAVAVFVTLSSRPASEPYRMVWLLTAAGLALLVTGEIVYVRDAFDGTESFRFNTVFKLGYQAWFLLAIVAAVTAYWSASWLGRRLRAAWLAGLACLLALALVYPAFGSYSRSAKFERSPTLDGMRWLEREAPGDAAAIEWLRRSVDGSPTLLEAIGPDFDPEGRGRVSTFTGIPAMIAWAGHEVQWGHELGSRLRDAATIYRTRDEALARRLLGRYDVRYVFVGVLERRDYPAATLAKFDRLGEAAFRSRGTVVYRIEPSSTR